MYKTLVSGKQTLIHELYCTAWSLRAIPEAQCFIFKCVNLISTFLVAVIFI